jgi:hypothetical protein
MKWNLRLAAANRGIWKASELQRMLAERDLVISAGKMSGLRFYCKACQSFGVTHEPGECAACHRVVPLKKGHCRLCWMQASLEAKGRVTILEPFLREIRHHQLAFADMQRWGARVPGQPAGRQGRRAGKPRPEPQPPPRQVTGWIQLKLFDARKDYTRFDRSRHADLASPWLARARSTAQAIGEARGWTRWVAQDVDRGLVILLSEHEDGDKVRYSEMSPVLRPHGLSVGRTAEVLAAVGVFSDDRVPAFETWLERSLARLAPGIQADVEHWLRTLRHGGPDPAPAIPRQPGSTCTRSHRCWPPGPRTTTTCAR